MTARILITCGALSLLAWSAGAQPPATPGPAPPTMTNPADGAERVVLPAGTFMMGSERGHRDEQPPHKVTLSSYAIDKYEVTNERYEAFCKATGHRKPAFSGNSKFNQPKRRSVSTNRARRHMGHREKR